MEKDSLVSVLMTAYNREKYIAEAIESVLVSTYTNFELIVVDDCSTDATVSIARSFEAKDNRISVYVNPKNLGQFPNRNKAANYAKGVYLKYFDSDDVMHPDMLEVMVNGMQKFSNAGLSVIGVWPKLAETDLPVEILPEDAYVNHYFERSPLLYVGPSGIMYKRDVFESFGKFDESIGILTDTLLSLRIAAIKPILAVKPNLFHWRKHDDQVTVGQGNQFEMIKERFQINKLVLADKNCPLNSAEIKIVERNLKNIFIRKFFVYLRIIKSPSKMIALSKLYKLVPGDLIKAFAPNKRVKKQPIV